MTNKLAKRCFGERGYHFGLVVVFILTYASFALNHSQRKTLSEVKTEVIQAWQSQQTPLFSSTTAAESFLGLLDALFMCAYALGLYVNGWLGDRYDPVWLLTFSMFGSGTSLLFFGCFTEWTQLYNVPYYVTLYMIFGFFQSMIVPNCITIMGKWTKKSNRGFVLGLWSSSQSVGNIIGALVSAAILPYGYQYAFLLNSLITMVPSVIVLLFTVADPKQCGLDPDTSDHQIVLENAHQNSESNNSPIGFFEALLLPSVIVYSISVMCVKLVNYAFFFWLPFYLTTEYHWPTSYADYSSTIYDIGAVFGSFIPGYITDKLGVRSPMLFLLIILSLPTLYLFSVCYCEFGWVATLMFIMGFTIGGPYNLMITTIAADLGAQSAIAGNQQAIATVQGIIDGTGSVGSAIGQFVIPVVSTAFSWEVVFAIFIVLNAIAALSMLKLVYVDTKFLVNKWTSPSNDFEIQEQNDLGESQPLLR